MRETSRGADNQLYVNNNQAKIRGARLHLVFIDETAYVPKFIIDTVVKPMMIVKRGYKVGERQDDYAGNKVLMTSTANYRFNHLYATFVDYFRRMIQPGNTQYFAMTLPYMVGIKVGLFDEEIVKQQREVMNDMEFQMEYLARFPRLVENAWIKYDDLQHCSNLNFLETEGVNSFEYIMSVDVARIAGQDNTVMDVFKLHWFANHVEVDLVYTKSMNGESFEEQAKQVRKLLIKFPQIIRIFQDTMTIGQGLTDELAKDYYDVDTDKWYPPLIDMNDETAMAARDKTKGVPIIYGIKATPEINHRMGYAVKTFTEKGWLHMYPFQVEENRELTLEEKQLVYETEATRMEVMNIETFGVSGGWVKFGTRSKRKDRWSAMGMGLYGAKMIYEERESLKDNAEPMFAFSRINNRR